MRLHPHYSYEIHDPCLLSFYLLLTTSCFDLSSTNNNMPQIDLANVILIIRPIGADSKNTMNWRENLNRIVAWSPKIAKQKSFTTAEEPIPPGTDFRVLLSLGQDTNKEDLASALDWRQLHQLPLSRCPSLRLLQGANLRLGIYFRECKRIIRCPHVPHRRRRLEGNHELSAQHFRIDFNWHSALLRITNMSEHGANVEINGRSFQLKNYQMRVVCRQSVSTVTVWQIELQTRCPKREIFELQYETNWQKARALHEPGALILGLCIL